MLGYEVLGIVKYKGFFLGLSVAWLWFFLKGRLIVDVYELVVIIGNVFILMVSYMILCIGFSIIWFLCFVMDLSYCFYSFYCNGFMDIDRWFSDCFKMFGIFYVYKFGYGVSSFFIIYKFIYKKFKGLSLNVVFNNVFN